MSVSIKTSHLAPARFSKISFGLTETHPRSRSVYDAGLITIKIFRLDALEYQMLAAFFGTKVASYIPKFMVIKKHSQTCGPGKAR